jgi:hypothetical protein
VTAFGEVLRSFREITHDPNRHKRPLSQARLGALIGHEMGDRGVSGAAVSDWERGKSKISVQDRNVLIAIIKVLYKCGGIKIPEDPAVEQSKSEPRTSKSLNTLLLENLFAISAYELKEAFARAEAGPSPSWPRKLAVLLRKASDRISLSPKTMLWIGIWWVAWWLTAPSLRWQFANRTAALQAIGMYVAGTLIVPLLIGMLVDTKQNEYWEAQGLARSRLLRLYTYQGAGIGFNIGYFLILPLILIRHYLNLGSSIWLEIAAVTLGLILGNMSARVVPHNLWLAYRRLRFADGAIFFVVAFLGPLWGLFFLEYYPVLLQPVWGSLVILAALTLFIMMTVQQSKKGILTKPDQP